MEDGIGNHALLHDHHDAAGKADHQGNPEQIPGAIDKTAGQFLFAQSCNDADHNGCTKEQRAHPGHPPALG